MKPRREALHEFLTNRLYSAEKATEIIELMAEFDRDRRAERKAETDARREKSAKRYRDYSRGLYSRWGTLSIPGGDFCDECGHLIEEGATMYAEIDHDRRDPETDAPYARFICDTCAPEKGIAPLIGGKAKFAFPTEGSV